MGTTNVYYLPTGTLAQVHELMDKYITVYSPKPTLIIILYTQSGWNLLCWLQVSRDMHRRTLPFAKLNVQAGTLSPTERSAGSFWIGNVNVIFLLDLKGGEKLLPGLVMSLTVSSTAPNASIALISVSVQKRMKHVSDGLKTQKSKIKLN